MTIKRTNDNKGWLYTLARIIFFYICTIVATLFSYTITENVSDRIADQLSMFLAAILTLLLVIVFTRWEKLNLNDVGIVPGKKSASRFSIGFGVGLLMAVTQAMIVLSFGHFQLKLVPEITMAEIGLPLLLYVLAGSREELVFRSYSLRSLSYSLTPFLALVIMTTIFSLEHLVSGNTWQNAIIGAGTGGILFGLAALKTKGLALPLGLHIAWNFGQWSLGFKGRPGIWEAIVEKGYESQVENIGLTAFLFVMSLAIAGVCIVYKKEKLF
ncbi:CPBP family intramembrane glutamic endopeptidase [Ulvibacterium sp.]|uniref:CPBP family intramembrane glutamic endopeptidase n=1 Tax=Ulvibacterium sp. TaxID=2665914 RepID=UPI003BAAE51F